MINIPTIKNIKGWSTLDDKDHESLRAFADGLGLVLVIGCHVIKVLKRRQIKSPNRYVQLHKFMSVYNRGTESPFYNELAVTYEARRGISCYAPTGAERKLQIQRNKGYKTL
jgi:hypothetical protein